MLISVPHFQKYQIYPVCHTTLWISSFFFIDFKQKLNYYLRLDLDAKPINADASGTDYQNNDTHSYITINDRSDKLYAAVHYDEAEERKSSSPISLRSITEHKSSESDNSNTSEIYLTPVVEAAVELKGESPRSSDYENVTAYMM